MVAAAKAADGHTLAFDSAALDAHLAEKHRTSAPHRVALAHKILAGTGCHLTEVERIGRGDFSIGELAEEFDRRNDAACALEFRHKGGPQHASEAPDTTVPPMNVAPAFPIAPRGPGSRSPPRRP